ncbi:hypothetical protein K432DRAFT_103022 [Lepidopterella palustris CBS 459.81]|uniref:Uncharacterized protein n=1 Tax=Lepidopterella palustris CBS 459.81 TaxID=1314670 RepID=A0A8E2E6E5_9PEZI|nr:hypothetical protein K432DRAFT_103022 [Lepidopterella palustris CBS 459.81]
MDTRPVTIADVILRTPSDWGPWFVRIQQAAFRNDIWQFVDPRVDEADLPVLTAPSEPFPVPSHIRPGATYATLDAIEIEFLKSLLWVYKYNMASYRKRREALFELVCLINSTISRDFWWLTMSFDCDSLLIAHKLLVALQARFCPQAINKSYARFLESPCGKFLQAQNQVKAQTPGQNKRRGRRRRAKN